MGRVRRWLWWRRQQKMIVKIWLMEREAAAAKVEREEALAGVNAAVPDPGCIP